MVRALTGKLEASGLKFAIVASRFNGLVTDRLREGALEALRRHGAREEDVDVVQVPGAFEIPLFAERLAASGRYDALICVGAVIQGETPHFQYIAGEVTRGVQQVMLDHGIPIAFGILTSETLEQAMERAGGKLGNKGWEAAVSAIEMANLLKEMRELSP